MSCPSFSDHGGVQGGTLRSDPVPERGVSAGEPPQPGPARGPPRQRHLPQG